MIPYKRIPCPFVNSLHYTNYKIYEFFFIPIGQNMALAFLFRLFKEWIYFKKAYTYTYLPMQKLLKYRFIWRSI